jgi:hypothetical protein
MTLETHNWDLVAALTYDEVNAAITSGGSSPTVMQQTSADGQAVMDVTCGAWSLSTGGDGGNIVMEVPITGGTLTLGGTPNVVTPATTYFHVTASFIPQPGNSMVNLSLAQDPAASATEPLPAQSNFGVQSALLTLLNEWVLNNLDQFTHVFAVVDLETDFADYPALSWMQPWHTGYAVKEPAQGATTATSVFAVLALVDPPSTQAEKDALISDVAFVVDLEAIPTGKDGGLVVSSHRFLQHLMLPAVPLMFQDINNLPPLDNFSIDNGGTRITNNAALTMQEVELDSGDKVKPAIEANEFSLSVDGEFVVVSVNNAKYSNSPGIDIKLNWSSNMVLGFDGSNNTLTLEQDSRTASGEVETSEALDILQIVAGVVAVVTAVVAAGSAVVSKAATAAVTDATAAAATQATATGGDMPAQGAIAVTTMGGLVDGTAASVTNLAARFALVAKIAAASAFAEATVTGAIGIAKDIADKKSKDDLNMGPFVDTAIEKAVTFPETPKYGISSAAMDTSMVFGLTKAAAL